jgi:hypothetical protein
VSLPPPLQFADHFLQMKAFESVVPVGGSKAKDGKRKQKNQEF